MVRAALIKASVSFCPYQGDRDFECCPRLGFCFCLVSGHAFRHAVTERKKTGFSRGLDSGKGPTREVNAIFREELCSQKVRG
jgi:hypothetical protein